MFERFKEKFSLVFSRRGIFGLVVVIPSVLGFINHPASAQTGQSENLPPPNASTQQLNNWMIQHPGALAAVTPAPASSQIRVAYAPPPAPRTPQPAPAPQAPRPAPALAAQFHVTATAHIEGRDDLN